MSDSTNSVKVRCADCGFLCAPARAGEFREATLDHRKGWGNALPICFVLALPQEDMALMEHGGVDPQGVVESHRDCSRFIQWQQGHSPKEHLEMQAAADQRKWQEERLEADRKHQAEQKAADAKRHEEQRAADQKWQQEQKRSDRRWQLFLAIMAAVFSLTTGTIGLFLGKMLNSPPPPPAIHINVAKDGSVDIPKKD
jgi:hypothetical protein